MKYLIIGDLHCRETWKEIVAKEDYDKVIFLGDYTVPREVILSDPTDACGFLYDVLSFKEKNPDKVILLRGNHCLASLGYYWARCYPIDNYKVQQYWQTKDVKNWYLNNTQWIYRIPDTNIVCSHAGISQVWLDNIIKSNQWKELLKQCESGVYEKDLIECINLLEPSELFAFTDDNPFDSSGESKTQPCTWIRPYTLLEYGVKGITHVVGHTPIKSIQNIKQECLNTREKFNVKEGEEIVNKYCDIWCCDCLANKEYLIIEDGEFKPCKI